MAADTMAHRQTESNEDTVNVRYESTVHLVDQDGEERKRERLRNWRTCCTTRTSSHSRTRSDSRTRSV